MDGVGFLLALSFSLSLGFSGWTRARPWEFRIVRSTTRLLLLACFWRKSPRLAGGEAEMLARLAIIGESGENVAFLANDRAFRELRWGEWDPGVLGF